MTKDALANSPICSMTGFARADGDVNGRRWQWELRSVNSRGLEARFRLATGFDYLEPTFRKVVNERLNRGNFSATLTLKEGGATSNFDVNHSALASAIKAIKDVQIQLDCDKPRPEAVLALRGIIEMDAERLDDEARNVIAKALVEGFEQSLSDLVSARIAEGKHLEKSVLHAIEQIEGLIVSAEKEAPSAMIEIREKLSKQLYELVERADISEERLAQEAALLVVKADIKEEIDRLKAHVAGARDIIEAGGSIGRRLDFLTQEFNREANTLCAKASNMALKQIGLDLKTVIDQLREQVQNVE